MDEVATISPDKMVPGTRYRVEFFDCCAEGWFEGVYVGPVMSPETWDEGAELTQDGWRFDTGEIGPASWGSWQIVDAEEARAADLARAAAEQAAVDMRPKFVPGAGDRICIWLPGESRALSEPVVIEPGANVVAIVYHAPGGRRHSMLDAFTSWAVVDEEGEPLFVFDEATLPLDLLATMKIDLKTHVTSVEYNLTI